MSKEEILALQAGLAGAWPLFRPWLDEKRQELVRNLVSANDEEARGRIKQLDEILELPERLQNEAIGFQQVQEEELP